MSELGSKGEILAASRCFALWPNNRHRSIGSACLFGAKGRAEHLTRNTFAVAMHQGGGGWVFQCSTSLT
jgi:hypothetical protein